MATRQALLAKLSQTLAGFVAARQWLGPEHAEYAAREACEKATVALAAETPYEEVGELIAHLRASGQLTAGLILRALLSGNVVLFEEALAELSGLPIDRVAGYIHDKHDFRLPRALSTRPGCRRPPIRRSARRSSRCAKACCIGEPGGAARLKRRMVERVLARLRRRGGRRRRAAAGAAAPFRGRGRARGSALFCDDLVRGNGCRRRTPAPIVLDERLVA